MAEPDRREARETDRDESMSVTRALEVLGLKAGATEQEIRAAYINLIKRVHADQGGSDYLPKQVMRRATLCVVTGGNEAQLTSSRQRAV